MRERAKMLPVFKELNIDLALQGHDHIYEAIGPVDENETAAVPLGVGTTAVFFCLCIKELNANYFRWLCPNHLRRLPKNHLGGYPRIIVIIILKRLAALTLWRAPLGMMNDSPALMVYLTSSTVSSISPSMTCIRAS